MFRTGEVLGIKTFPFDPLGELLIFLGHHLNDGQTITALKRGAQRIGESLLNSLAGNKTINHHFDVVAVVLVELDVVG